MKTDPLPGTPLVSVCLPVRNGAPFLSQALDSVLTQTWQDFELLISDDCSSDGSEEIIAHYAKADRRIICHRNAEPLGLFGNYNKCMELATGEFIKPFAQDDLWSSQLLEKQVAFLRNHNSVALVTAGRVIIDEQGRSLPITLQAPQIDTVLGKWDVYPSQLVGRSCLLPVLNLIGEPCAVMFRRAYAGTGFSSVFKHAGDLEYWLRILNCGDLGMLDEPLVYFRRHARSSTDKSVRELSLQTDVIHLANAVAKILAELGCSKERFIEHNLAYFTQVLPRANDGSLDVTGIDEVSESTESDVTALRKALLYALGMITSASGNGHQERAEERQILINMSRIGRAEVRLRSLLDTFSWRATRPLREVNKLLGSKVSDNDDLEPDCDDASVLNQQYRYLQFLDKTTARVLQSRSWRITRFLRRTENTFVQDYQDGVAADCEPEALDQSMSKSLVISWRAKRPYDVIVGIHEATRTGAPMLALTLCREFASRGLNCLAVLKRGGQLISEITKVCDTLDLTHSLDPHRDLTRELGMLLQSNRISKDTPAFMNSAELHDLCVVFKQHSLSVISLIHEYLSDYPQVARNNILRNADFTVYPSRATLEDAESQGQDSAKARIIAQGLLEPGFGNMSKRAGKAFLENEFGVAPDSFVVLSCGNSDQRKGVDIFAQVAQDILLRSDCPPDIHFVWVGANHPITFDAIWWAKHDAKKTGIGQNVHFTKSQKDLDIFFAGADLFLLTSRQDPMPCVLHLAQAARLPIVAFSDSGGAADVLSLGGGRLVPYGDTLAMKHAILSYYNDREACTTDGAAGSAIVSEHYRMDVYADKLLELANLSTGLSRPISCSTLTRI